MKYIVVKILSHLFNASLTAGSFPSQFKVAKVTAVYSARVVHDKEKYYRPFPILKSFDNILEKIVSKMFVNYLNKNDIPSSCHFGYI